MKTVLFILLILNTSFGYASFTGRVFLQETSSNQPKLNITGISNVAVSDGLNVVLTDKDGFFELPGNSKTRFIYITVPAGYTTSDRHYIKVDDQISSYDFELNPFPLSAKEDIRFIQITDTETYIDNGWIQPVRDYASNEKVSFIVHAGDICYRRAMVFHSKYVNNETMGVPVFYCIGNHDMEEGNYGEELFEKLFGPVYYSFQDGNTHFIVTPMLQGTHRPSYSKEDVYRWMKNDLKHVDPSKNVVVFNHFLLTTEDEFIYGINDEEQINLNDHNLKAWIYGHHHANYKKQHGNTGIISVQSSPANKGGINHSPSNFLVHEINQKGEITVVPRYNFLDNHFTVITPNRHNYAIDNTGQLKISVNTYSTRSPTAKVEYKIGEEGKWLQLDQKTDWNWAGTYPAEDLQGAKSHKITFRVLLGNEDLFTRSGYFLFSEKNDKDYSRESSNKTVRPPTYGNNEENTLQLAWVSNAGANIWMCSPVYENGTVYIATLDEFSGENNYIAAFDAKSGEPDWKYRINSPVKNSISIDNGIVFATDQEGTAYAINGRTGSLVWKRDLGRTSLQGYISGGVIYEGVYYTGYGNYLSALDISDGRVLWKNDSWNGGFFDSNVSYTGSYSYRIEDNSATSNTEGRTRELIPVNNIDSYRLSWAARSLEEGQRYVVGVECYNQEKELFAFENRFEIYTGQTEWKSERLNLGTFNDEIMYLRIRLFPSEKTITGEHTGTVWFDEISLYNTNTGQNEFPAGNFEVNPDAIDILLDFADFNEAGRRYFDDYGFNGYRLSLKGLGGGTYYSRTNGIFEGFEQGTDEYGILIWETTYWNSTEASPPGYLQNPWEEPMSFVTGYGWPMGKQTIWGNGGGRFFYPFNRDPNNDPATYTGKPVPSLRLEILRDGIEDYEYFVLLEKLVSSPKNRNRKIVEEARELLTLPEVIYSDEKTYSKNPQDILEYRKKIAEYILKLMK